jgi:hypothetical protein
MNDKERCDMLIDEERQLMTENAKLLDEMDELRKTCKIFDKENAELRKELNEVGRKWLNDFSRQDTQITELKARWVELKEIEHEHRTIEGKQWISLGLLKRMMRELEQKKEMKA